jgi:hypothetical protein
MNRWRLEVEAPDNGRVRKATVTVLDRDDKVKLTDRADLLSLPERKKLCKRLAERLDVTPESPEEEIESKWSAAIQQRREAQQAAKGGAAEAGDDFDADILDSSPNIIRRPLCLVEGTAHAATWIHVRQWSVRR